MGRLQTNRRGRRKQCGGRGAGRREILVTLGVALGTLGGMLGLRAAGVPMSVPSPFGVLFPPAVRADAPGGAIGPLGLTPPEDERARFTRGLQSLLETEALRINGRVSVHVRILDGPEAGLDPDRPVPAASIIKVPVMAALYDAWNDQQLKRNKADERRLRLMITRSSNRLTNVLIEELGMERINRWLHETGYDQTSLRAMILKEEPYGPNLTTAREMTRMLEQIQRRELVSANASMEMRQLLLDQRWRTRIPAGLPPGVKVGNKTGTMSDLLHDVAFVEDPGGVSYTISVFIERADRSTVKSDEIAELSRSVHSYITTYWRPPLQTQTASRGTGSTPLGLRPLHSSP